MGKQELEEILSFKIRRELDLFKDKMSKLELNEILANAYQVDAMINIYEQLLMMSQILGKRVIEKMILFPDLLDYLYEKWMQEEDSYNDELQSCIMKAINQLQAQETRKKEAEAA